MSSKTVKWGVLGTAKIAIKQVIPAIQKSNISQLEAIASRTATKAQALAKQFDIPKAYGNYEDLIADPTIDAIYIPLPNHLHVAWAKRSLEAGKHVLCEKPLALEAEAMKELITLRNKTGLKVSEAFMVKTHPQWAEIKSMISNGAIGKLQTIHGFFSYMLTDAYNVRNVKAYGGGGLYDIGCYPITLSRFIYGEEPQKVFAQIQYDEQTDVDVMASAILVFKSGTATFTCGMQMQRSQTMQFYGTEKSLEVRIPFNPPNDQPNKLYLMDGELSKKYSNAIIMPAYDQYKVHIDHFSEAILLDKPVAVSLEDTYDNTRVLEALFRSGESGKWELL